MRSGGMRIVAVVVVLLMAVAGAGLLAGAGGAAAQEPAGSAQDDGSELNGSQRRLVNRESSATADAVVLSLFAIAGGMTVMLGLFLWHTSPRRRLRLARERSQERADAATGADGSASEPGIRRASLWSLVLRTLRPDRAVGDGGGVVPADPEAGAVEVDSEPAVEGPAEADPGRAVAEVDDSEPESGRESGERTV